MWVVCNPSPSISAYTEGTKTPRSGLSLYLYGDDEETDERSGPTSSRGGSFNFFTRMRSHRGVAVLALLSARELDLELISRVAGCELAFALPPPLTTPEPSPPSLPLFTRSASRRRATAPWHANARRAAPWFDRRAVPRALL